MFESGIRTVCDIIDNQGRILSYEVLCEKYSLTSDLLTYHGIINAIPTKWNWLFKENSLEIVCKIDGSPCNINRVMKLAITTKCVCVVNSVLEMR